MFLCDEIGASGKLVWETQREDVLVCVWPAVSGSHQFHPAPWPPNGDILGIEILAAVASLVAGST